MSASVIPVRSRWEWSDLLADAAARGARYAAADMDAPRFEFAQDWLRASRPASALTIPLADALARHGALTPGQAAALLNHLVGLAEPTDPQLARALAPWQGAAESAAVVPLHPRRRRSAFCAAGCGVARRLRDEYCSAKCARAARREG